MLISDHDLVYTFVLTESKSDTASTLKVAVPSNFGTNDSPKFPVEIDGARLDLDSVNFRQVAGEFDSKDKMPEDYVVQHIVRKVKAASEQGFQMHEHERKFFEYDVLFLIVASYNGFLPGIGSAVH